MAALLRLCCLLLFPLLGLAQTSPRPVRIAVLAPLYLDSAFAGYSYVKPLGSIPRYMQAGLDFYQGVMAATDSFQRRGPAPEIIVYDTKSAGKSIEMTMGSVLGNKCQLILAALTNPQEQQAVAAAAFSAGIPTISATYPNDVGVQMNPFFVILNPTLKTHLAFLFAEARKAYPNRPLIIATQNGSAEDMMAEQLKALATQFRVPYKIWNSSQSGGTGLPALLDTSGQQNLIFCASLSESFAEQVHRAATASMGRSLLLGMPNWESFERLQKPGKVEVWYSDAATTGSSLSGRLSTIYRHRYLARASDAYYRGYEALYRFGNLFYAHGDSLLYKLNDPRFQGVNAYQILPVAEQAPGVPDYLENKRLVLKKLGGAAEVVDEEDEAKQAVPTPATTKPTATKPAASKTAPAKSSTPAVANKLPAKAVTKPAPVKTTPVRKP